MELTGIVTKVEEGKIEYGAKTTRTIPKEVDGVYIILQDCSKLIFPRRLNEDEKREIHFVKPRSGRRA